MKKRHGVDVAPPSWILRAPARDVELYDVRSCEATGLELARQQTHNIEPAGSGRFRERISERRINSIGGKGAGRV